AEYQLISSDSHVYEPQDLWTARMESKFKDRAPSIIRQDDGDWWYCDGRKVAGTGAGSQTGRRFENPDELSRTDRFEHVRQGGYIPEARIKDMDLDGVAAEVVYPTIGFLLYNMVDDSQLLSACFRSYNDWLAEFCNAYPDRLKGVALINLDDVQEGVTELQRARKIGLVGALITAYPRIDRPYSSSEYDPFWAAAQDLDMPLGMHIATYRPGPDQLHGFQDIDRLSPAFLANADHWVRMSLADMIFSGLFERYPRLKVGTVEQELSWIPHFLDRIDYTYTQRARRAYWHRFKGDVLPSDFFHQNVFCSFQEDALGIRDRAIIGVDNLMWGSDYPHQESTWPKSRQILDKILEGIPDEEKAKIAGGNVARVYHLA
ncbi:MAG TPA: amidohydrolase family protein, partial [Gammaproteobacteria bacterium]|nr:amidohydrolase family protein [Gammaproteobacteria bacterium]